MNKLSEHYQSHSAAMLERLQQATSLSELVQSATIQLNGLVGSESTYGGGLTPREQRLVNCFFDAVIGALYLLYKVEVKVDVPVSHEPQSTENGSAWQKKAGAVALASTAGAALAPGIPLALLAGLGLGGATIIAMNQPVSARPSETEVEAAQVGSGVVTSFVNPDEILECIRSAVENFDTLVGEIEELRTEARRENMVRPIELDEMPNILSFFYEMLGFQQSLTELPKPLQDYLLIIPRILRGYKVEVVHYRAGVNDDWFEEQSKSGEQIDAPVTLKPALVKEGEILMKGVIMVPESG